MKIRFSKIRSVSFITLLIMMFFFTGCAKRRISVEPIKDDKPSGTSTKYSDTSSDIGSDVGSDAGLGKPYTINGIQYIPQKQSLNYTQKGIASWYGKKFHGRKTANGEIYDMHAMTAAHKTLPLNTWVRVHNLNNNREIVVRINDRGPFVKGRIIDLSFTGAKKIGIAETGTAPVKVTVLGALKNPKAKIKEYVPVNCYNGNFSVQVGAFQVKANALQLRNELSMSYKDVHIVTHNDHRGSFYRVRIGKYSQLKPALMLEKELSVNGLKTVFLIAE